MIVEAAMAAGAVATFFSLVMFFHRSLYVSAVCLLVVLLQTGVMFFLCGAPLLGLLQIMIYAGAVMVLVVVTVMAAGAEGEQFSEFSFPRPLAWLGFGAVVAEAVVIARACAGASQPVFAVASSGNAFSSVLFQSYALATEAVTLLMFLAALAIVPRPKVLR